MGWAENLVPVQSTWAHRQKAAIKVRIVRTETRGVGANAKLYFLATNGQAFLAADLLAPPTYESLYSGEWEHPGSEPWAADAGFVYRDS